MARGLYFGVVFWGKDFREDFLDYCLSSLLAPGNIPSVTEKTESRFLMCTTRSDWEAMQNHSTFLLLKQHVEPVWLELAPGEGRETKMQMMSRGHRMIAEAMHDRRVWGTYIYPDTVVADGVVSRLQELAVQGKKVVLAHCPRFANQHFLRSLRETGLIKPGVPLALPGRRLMTMAMPHMHSETRRYQWESAYFHAEFPSLVWWAVPSGGMLFHTFAWAPLLIDYGRIEHHDTWTLENWTIDGDYVFRNVHSPDEVYAETDPDAMTLISFTDEARLSYLPLNPRHIVRLPGIGTWYRKMCLRHVLNSTEIDPLKRRLFRLPIYVPGEDGGEDAGNVQRHAERILEDCSRPLSNLESKILYWFRVFNEGPLLHLGFWAANRPRLLQWLPAGLRNKLPAKT